jgi:two-component system OmpR family sensor kinase
VKSFRAALAFRVALGVLALLAAAGVVSVFALRTILYRQLDGTLLHLAEVEAQAGAATSGSDFQFHEGVLLAAREGPSVELIRYAQLWSHDGKPVVRSRNLSTDLALPRSALAEAGAGRVATFTRNWRGRTIRSVVYPLELVGAAHQVHLLQVAAPTEPLRQTLTRFSGLVVLLTLLGTLGAYGLGRKLATVALRPTGEITAQAEAISEGTLSERITAHANVDEFTRLVTVLNGMLNRLDRAFQVQRQFTADASHELRAPLTVLKGDIDVTLKRDRSAAEYRETLVRCREEVERLARLATDLLVLARSDAALPLEHVAEVELRGLVGRVVERFQPVAEARKLRLEVVAQEAVVHGDERLLDRIVTNLLDNAVKHSQPGGRVRIELVRDGDAVLTLRDEGPGIQPEHVPQLFVRFFRGDPARRRSEGTGLGLAIARAAAEAHGGRLEFLGNAPGAVFRLSLPLASYASATAPIAAGAASLSTARTSRSFQSE